MAACCGKPTYLRFKPGVDPAKARFYTGYDKANIASWLTFSILQKSGKILSHRVLGQCGAGVSRAWPSPLLQPPGLSFW